MQLTQSKNHCTRLKPWQILVSHTSAVILSGFLDRGACSYKGTTFIDMGSFDLLRGIDRSCKHVWWKKCIHPSQRRIGWLCLRFGLWLCLCSHQPFQSSLSSVTNSRDSQFNLLRQSLRRNPILNCDNSNAILFLQSHNKYKVMTGHHSMCKETPAESSWQTHFRLASKTVTKLVSWHKPSQLISNDVIKYNPPHLTYSQLLLASGLIPYTLTCCY